MYMSLHVYNILLIEQKPTEKLEISPLSRKFSIYGPLFNYNIVGTGNFNQKKKKKWMPLKGKTYNFSKKIVHD